MIKAKKVRAYMCALTLLTYTGILPAQEYTVTFDEAYNDVFTQSYAIKAAEENVEGRKANTWQAGRRPNPILTIEGENLGHNIRGNENELYFAITQPIEIGGKREARERFADAAECESYWDLEVVKNDVANDFLHAFVSVAAAQERIALANKQSMFSKELVNQVKYKIDSGKGSGLEMKKAEIAYNSSVIQISQKQASLKQQMRRLKAFWPCSPQFSAVTFPIYNISQPPSLESLMSCMDSNPLVARAQANASKTCRLLELERAQRYPTIAMQVGVATEEFYKDPTVTVGFDIPLYVFDKNTGNIESALHEHYRAVYEQKQAMMQLTTELEVTYNEWMTAYEQAMMLKNEILPKAEEAHEFSKQGFAQGKFNYLEYLDAQNILLDAQQQYLDAVEEYHHKRADVLKLANTVTSEQNCPG
jgi:cobalt-zinc-cadmium efflux system outer membrane protein